LGWFKIRVDWILANMNGFKLRDKPQ
jgi:hypothetical protein